MDVVGVALQRGAGPRQLRVLVRKFQEILHDGPAFRTIIAEQRRGSAQMHFFNGCKSRQTERLSRDDDDQRRSAAAKANANPR